MSFMRSILGQMIRSDHFLAHVILTIYINRWESDFSQEQFVDFIILFLNINVKIKSNYFSANLVNSIDKHGWWWSEGRLAFQEFWITRYTLLCPSKFIKTDSNREWTKGRPSTADTYRLLKTLSLNNHWCFVLHWWCRSSKGTRRQDNQTRQLHFLDLYFEKRLWFRPDQVQIIERTLFTLASSNSKTKQVQTFNQNELF